jgi:hypothetical protein
MSEPERDAVIGMRVLDMTVEPVPGSVQVPCIKCRNLTWLGGAGQALLAQGYEVKCLRCAEPDPDEVRAAPGALEELELFQGRGARADAERLLAAMNRSARKRHR